MGLIAGGREPFDLVEAESELIAGLLTELSGGIFALLLLTETTEGLYLLALPINIIYISSMVIVSIVG